MGKAIVDARIDDAAAITSDRSNADVHPGLEKNSRYQRRLNASGGNFIACASFRLIAMTTMSGAARNNPSSMRKHVLVSLESIPGITSRAPGLRGPQDR